MIRLRFIETLLLFRGLIPCMSFLFVTRPLFPSVKLRQGDDDYIDEKDLGDWRNFRSTLVDRGISFDSVRVEEGYIDSDDDYTNNKTGSGTPSEIDASKGSSVKRPKSVSKANEELLEQQSKDLAREYKDGVWAHSSSIAEVGGLVLRLPLEVELYRSSERNEIKISTNDVVVPLSVRYQKAQTLIKKEMEVIAKLANERGEIDPTGLTIESESLLNSYIDNQQNWQEVCLVAERNVKNGSAKTYTLNRPMAFQLNDNLAKLLMFGAQITSMTNGRVPASETDRYEKFLEAFEECAVYFGGPNLQDKPAVMVHGISDLDGASELSPGVGLYLGGLDAAVRGILEKKYQPLDFRFFIGCHVYRDSDLDFAINSNKYQPIAAARPLALKQCLQLPKPLWHEVMELCGGELREISLLELKKRDDIQE